MSSFVPTVEQENIINSCVRGNNVSVCAVAGSGKTTTAMILAQRCPEKKILLLTYSKMLKEDARIKARRLGIKNLEIHSYHSFCVKYYKKNCFEDSGIQSIINKDTSYMHRIEYDIIIVDELQDMTPQYFKLFSKIYRDNGISNSNLLLIGDVRQCIFQFKKSDSRYLSLAPDLFTWNNKEWVTHNLSTSFRLTHELSNFMNKVVLNEEIFQTVKSGPRPRYIIGNIYSVIEKEIMYYMNERNINPEDILIIAASVKNPNSPICKASNVISKKYPHIMQHVCNEDNISKQEIRDGKLCFNTMASTKGLEYEAVIVVGFDDSYFQYFDKKATNKNICPNILYVAPTRSKKHLSLIHSEKNEYLPFLNKEIIEAFCEKIGSIKNDDSDADYPKNSTCVTDLISHLPASVIQQCIEKTDKYVLNEAEGELKINGTIRATHGNLENIADIIGEVLPRYFAEKNGFDTGVLKEAIQYYKKRNISNILPEKTKDLVRIINNISDLDLKSILLIGVMWDAAKKNLYYKTNQLKFPNDYNWINATELDKAMKRLGNLNIHTETANFESFLSEENNQELMRRKLNGYADCIDQDCLYEFKATSSLNDDHYLQLALYAYLFTKSINKPIETCGKRFILFNILTNEKVELKFTTEKLSFIVNMLMQNKYGVLPTEDQAAFIQNNRVISFI